MLTGCKALDSRRGEGWGLTASELPLPCGSKVEWHLGLRWETEGES